MDDFSMLFKKIIRNKRYMALAVGISVAVLVVVIVILNRPHPAETPTEPAAEIIETVPDIEETAAPVETQVLAATESETVAEETEESVSSKKELIIEFDDIDPDHYQNSGDLEKLMFQVAEKSKAEQGTD